MILSFSRYEPNHAIDTASVHVSNGAFDYAVAGLFGSPSRVELQDRQLCQVEVFGEPK